MGKTSIPENYKYKFQLVGGTELLVESIVPAQMAGNFILLKRTDGRDLVVMTPNVLYMDVLNFPKDKEADKSVILAPDGSKVTKDVQFRAN